jgi:hypothetical protein
VFEYPPVWLEFALRASFCFVSLFFETVCIVNFLTKIRVYLYTSYLVLYHFTHAKSSKTKGALFKGALRDSRFFGTLPHLERLLVELEWDEGDSFGRLFRWLRRSLRRRPLFVPGIHDFPFGVEGSLTLFAHDLGDWWPPCRLSLR